MGNELDRCKFDFSSLKWQEKIPMAKESAACKLFRCRDPQAAEVTFTVDKLKSKQRIGFSVQLGLSAKVSF